MTQPMVLGIVRHVLTTLGGVLVSAGWVDESSAQEVAGALLALIGVGWSIYVKRAGK